MHAPLVRDDLQPSFLSSSALYALGCSGSSALLPVNGGCLLRRAGEGCPPRRVPQ